MNWKNKLQLKPTKLFIKRRYDQWLYNAAIRLFYREENMWYLLNMELPKIKAYHITNKMEPGVTGMYD